MDSEAYEAAYEFVSGNLREHKLVGESIDHGGRVRTEYYVFKFHGDTWGYELWYDLTQPNEDFYDWQLIPPYDVAEFFPKQNPSCSYEDQLRLGTEVEMEHTSSRKRARRIATDHLEEFPRPSWRGERRVGCYYGGKGLGKLESELKRGNPTFELEDPFEIPQLTAELRKAVLREAMKDVSTAVSPSVFLLPNGDHINTTEDHYTTARSILFSALDMERMPRTFVDNALFLVLEAGLIRVLFSAGGGLELELAAPPTETQWRTLARWGKNQAYFVADVQKRDGTVYEQAEKLSTIHRIVDEAFGS